MTRALRVLSRVVFDTSTLVSAVLRKDSIPWQAFVHAMSCTEVCASQQTLEEFRVVVSRSKFDRYLPLAERERFVREFESRVRVFVVPQNHDTLALPRCRDANDQKFLDLAYAAEAELIVASDEDLLVLSPWNDIQIVRPASFVEAMTGRT